MKTYFGFIQQLNEVAKGGTVPWAGKTRGPYYKGASGERMLADLEADAKQYAERMREMAPIYAAIDAYRAGKDVDERMMKVIEPYIKAMGIKRGNIKNKLEGTPAPSRPAFNWKTGGAGWWHPTKQWFRFSHDGHNYHVTQIVKNPQAFGITNKELNDAMAEFGYRNNYALNKETAAIRVRHMILNGTRDLCMPVQRLAYKLGWLKVYGGSDPYLEGYERSQKLAMREIIQVMGNLGRVEVAKVNEHSKVNWPETSKFYSTLDAKEKFSR